MPHSIGFQTFFIGRRQLVAGSVGLCLALFALYFTTWINYLLFHTLAELFSILIGYCLFIITWHARGYLRNNYLLFLGLAYLFISSLDLLHTLAYNGMPIFTDYDFYASQLWIGTRYLESISLALAPFFLRPRTRFLPERVLAGYLIVTLILVLSIFVWKVFPACFVAGSGLTPFKVVSEYLICLILVSAAFLLRARRSSFEPVIYRVLQLSIFFTIVSELAFTFYVSAYGVSNLVGHYFKILSFLMIYMAFIRTGLEEPFRLIFRSLDQANVRLGEEIVARRRTQEENEALIVELQQALNDIRTLQGIIPICSECKSIRDEKGSWEKLETYIEQNSEAQFSHGICGHCAEKIYGKEAWYRRRRKNQEEKGSE